MVLTLKNPLRVHICPVGDDDVDRIVEPALLARADKVYLFLHEGDDLFANIHEQVKSRFISAGLAQGDIIDKQCNFYDFTAVMVMFASIIRDENVAGNSIFINVSTGGKLNAIAGILSALLLGATPYFCKKNFTTGSIPSNPEIITFPKYAIPRLDLQQVKFLNAIQLFMKIGEQEEISKGQCLDLLKNVDDDFASSTKTPGDYNRLKFKYLDKLIEQDLIEIRSKPRGGISLTPDGQFALKILAAYYGIKENEEN